MEKAKGKKATLYRMRTSWETLSLSKKRIPGVMMKIRIRPKIIKIKQRLH
jgi:hypothetical protein